MLRTVRLSPHASSLSPGSGWPVLMMLALASLLPTSTRAAVDFNRDVRPILSGHCFKCHGPDDGQRQAGLRFDLRAAAIQALKDGRRAIVPGKPDESELVRRIFTSGSAVMPPPSANHPLSLTQKQILKEWIREGAVYKQHWAFVSPRRPPLPKVRDHAWPRNPIDYFVLAKLEAAGLKPSPEADRYTLCRRVYLDLIGLPPTPEQADAFVSDKQHDAYERLVDRWTLASVARLDDESGGCEMMG